MKRIAIIGCSGSGKSTLARQIGAILDIPVIHLDAIFWQPDWVQTPRDEWRHIQEELIKPESWIIDGNYTNTLDIRMAAADTIIFLDYPRGHCLYRVLKRRVQYAGKTRPDLASGCSEKIDWQHIQWIWSYPNRDRKDVLQKLEQYSAGHTIIILHNPAEARQFLEKLKAQKA
jgi:adenylate kinase family enzyme